MSIFSLKNKPQRRSRHIRSQMKYFGGERWKWDYAKSKKRDFRSW